MPTHRNPWRRALTAASAVLLAGFGLATAPTAAEAAASCTATYTKIWDNGSGFGANLTVTNTGDPLTTWELSFDFPGTQVITQMWGGVPSPATPTPAGAAVTVGPASYNAAQGTGATWTVGFNGTYTGGANNAPPGVSCSGNGSGGTQQALVVAPTSVNVPEGATAGYTVRLREEPSGDVTVTSTAGTGDSDITVSDGASLTFTAADWDTPQTVTLSAAQDSDRFDGTRPISVASSGLSSVTVNATEADDDDGTNLPAPILSVSGNRLVANNGNTYRLLGVNRASGEFACVQGKGMWDGGPVDKASIDAMKAWNIHAVRIPLNEECWVGVNGSPSGATYQQNVKDYVNLLVSNGVTPIVEMHWSHGQYTGPGAGCSDTAATCQKPMPDAQYAPTFWTGVANAFKGTNSVVFDLFNEPYPDAAANWDATAGWTCWRDGGTCTGIGYEVAGMQDLVDAVRATGATNVIMLGGLTWSNDLSQWLTYKPDDPTGNLMAAWHTYNFNACSNAACWDSQVGAVAAQVPVHAGEIGQDSCAHDYIDQVTAWADAHGVGYTAWTWNPWGCGQGNVLITDYDGTPTSTYGEGFKAHLLTQTPFS
ncbi:cellulase family glycosylhydrolase [Nonomuraea phyllanthi]|uniref:cellulase family glycosylhydrolase n=1 Tax=Nonomuraea phyllanthi TaxID=2219224 RepID=UPI0012933A85|nr:cellulase family glycosylhydrolase [Nonomuraea phyllanthi]QFY13444.1 cellulase family glycosylhydrolase [Nonomuraea phyllanthi]